MATQSVTQVLSQDLTCTFTNGNGTKTFHREGVRDGERTGTRTGSRVGTREGSRVGDREGIRTGTQTGVQTGTIAYDLDVEARKANQYTGFVLKGWKGQPVSSTVGAPAWNAASFGDWEFGDWSFAGEFVFAGTYSFDAAYTFGDATFEPISGTEWGDWDAAPGENPDDCLRSDNADKITDLSNVITPGAITGGAVVDGAISDGAVTAAGIVESAITEGAVSYGAITRGEVTKSGPAALFVNGKLLPAPAL
ncbi:hypothetical protein AAIB33_04830 [Microbacterium sp. AZCO]|uniref:hypothetical protein n=1 Tax=Microbacterium sp. AZCO TaxID=3142976 RepID=UPI0031F3B812